jgi:PPOX class probable F420-dependent enzyme
MPLTDAQREFLQAKNFAHLATLNADGSPQVTPVWIDVEGDIVLFNTEKKRLKTRNLERDGRVAICVSSASDPYKYLEIRGKVVGSTEEGAFEHIDALAKKYMDADKYPFNEEGHVRVIFKLSTDKVHGRI